MSCRILIVDDHTAIHSGIREITSAAIPEAQFGSAQTEQDALDQVHREHWDLAIIDINLNGSSGIDLIARFRNERPQIRILIYSMYSDEHFGVRALRSGANGYLSKASPAEELPAAIRKVLDTGFYAGPRLAVALARVEEWQNEEPAACLSQREHQVLRMIASGKRSTDIADALSVSIKTVSTYRARILEKLDLKTNADLIRYAVTHHLIS